jgi:hypothetical protein
LDYQWLSHRRYKLDAIKVFFTHLEYYFGSVDEISCEKCWPIMDQRRDYTHVNSLSSLYLVEGNPHLKKLIIDEDESDYTFNCRMFQYLSQHCPEVNELIIYTTSAETIRVAMNSFPNLVSVECHALNDIDFTSLEGVMS